MERRGERPHLIRRLLHEGRLKGPLARKMAGWFESEGRSRSQGIVLFLCRLLVRSFFRSIEVEGLEHVPRTGGGIVVSWHPNGLIDPVLIYATLPRPLIFGAREGLFHWPLLGFLMRAAGTVPIHRAEDKGTLGPEARRQANQGSLDALARVVAEGGFSCLFPEGDSHDASHFITFKTGVARFYYQARSQVPEPPLILPVGLHYDAKRKFRSHVLVRYHPPLRLPPDLDAGPDPKAPDAVRSEHYHRLTALIEQELRQVVLVTENWELHHRMNRASKILRAERASQANVELDDPSMLESQVGFWRIWEGFRRWQVLDPSRVEGIMTRIGEYDADLRALHLEDTELDHPPHRGRVGPFLLLMAQGIGVFLVSPIVILLGGLVNVGPYAFLRLAVGFTAKKQKDVATIKLLGGAVLYPLAWLAAGLVGAWASIQLHAASRLIPATPVLAGLMVVLLAIAGGMIFLHYLRLFRETARAMRVRITRLHRRKAIVALRRERARLAADLEALESGMDLPGSVSAEGTVLATEDVPPGGRA